MYPSIRKSFAVQAKSINEREGLVEAIVNVTNLDDRQRDNVRPGAFRKAVNGKMPKVVNSHDSTQFLGKALSLRELMPGDPSLPPSLLSKGYGGLWAKMQFNLETAAGSDMFSNVKGGFVDEWSFLFSIADADHDGRGIRQIKLVDEIFEISPVLVGASQATMTLAAKAASAPNAKASFARLASEFPRRLQPKFWAAISKATSPASATRRAIVAEATEKTVGEFLYWKWVHGEIEYTPRIRIPDGQPQSIPRPEGNRYDDYR